MHEERVSGSRGTFAINILSIWMPVISWELDFECQLESADFSPILEGEKQEKKNGSEGMILLSPVLPMQSHSMKYRLGGVVIGIFW